MLVGTSRSMKYAKKISPKFKGKTGVTMNNGWIAENSKTVVKNAEEIMVFPSTFQTKTAPTEEKPTAAQTPV